MITFQELVMLEQQSCGKCGGVFALNQAFLTHARNNGGDYYCPYCQVRWMWAETEADRLRKKLRESECETLSERKLREAAERKLNHVQKRSIQRKATCKRGDS